MDTLIVPTRLGYVWVATRNKLVRQSLCHFDVCPFNTNNVLGVPLGHKRGYRKVS